jgi:hypothetical protein
MKQRDRGRGSFGRRHKATDWLKEDKMSTKLRKLWKPGKKSFVAQYWRFHTFFSFRRKSKKMFWTVSIKLKLLLNRHPIPRRDSISRPITSDLVQMISQGHGTRDGFLKTELKDLKKLGRSVNKTFFTPCANELAYVGRSGCARTYSYAVPQSF